MNYLPQCIIKLIMTINAELYQYNLIEPEKIARLAYIINILTKKKIKHYLHSITT